MEQNLHSSHSSHSAPCNTKESAGHEDDGKVHRAWIITWNNYTEEEYTWFKEYAESRCDQVVCQQEKGANGTPHIQGGLYFKNARTFKALKKDLPKCHIEWAKSWGAVKNYCKKKETRDGETFTVGVENKPRFPFAIKDVMANSTPRPFQQQILDLIKEEPDDRTIYWFWESQGNVGKTALARHICIKNPNALYLTGKAADMKYAVFNMVEAGVDIKVVLIDLTRTSKDFTGSTYQGIEEIKNGIFFNNKYESKMCIFNPPHIICFANWEPNMNMLSEDRWEVIEIC